MKDYEFEIENRVDNEKVKGFFVAKTLLSHLSMVTYKVPKSRLVNLVPKELELFTIKIGGEEWALINVVAYKSEKFRFKNLLPFINFDYGQVNFRTFVRNRAGEWSVFFLNNAVGTSIYRIPKWLWKLPWYKARFKYYKKDKEYRLTTSYRSERDVEVDLELSDRPIEQLEGFDSFEHMKFIMTHAYKGYYIRNTSGVAEYAIWHRKFQLSKATPRKLFYRYLLESGLVLDSEMNDPFACWVGENIEYICQFPPSKVTWS